MIFTKIETDHKHSLEAAAVAEKCSSVHIQNTKSDIIRARCMPTVFSYNTAVDPREDPPLLDVCITKDYPKVTTSTWKRHHREPKRFVHCASFC